MAAVPPRLWQSDLNSEQEATVGAAAPRDAAQESNEKLSDAWRHVKVVARDVGREADLYDLLISTNRSDTYQLQTTGWPSLLRPLSPIMAELPAMVLEKHAACQAMCFNGIFPQIGRAWASVDNVLFLWRYDRSNDVPVKYSGEEQTISAVCLVKPRPGIFLAAVQHLLVVCTASEIVLLGVCTSGPRHEELTLQPLPLYTLPTDGVLMCSCAASSSGRIFLGGADGHVYELQYNAADTWRHRRVAKVCLTGGLRRLFLPSFIPESLFGKHAVIEQLVLDDERHMLYALATSPSGPAGTACSNSIMLFDLGHAGQDTPRRVADVPDLYQAARSAVFGSDVFAERKGSAAKYLTPISSADSHKLQLLVVTADGRRVYFAVLPRRYGSREPEQFVDPARQRPQLLSAMMTRVAVPPIGQAAGAVNPVDMSRSGSMQVTAALYSRGCLLLAELVGNEARSTRLLAAARNLSLPATSLNTAPSSSAGSLRELVTELENHIPGEACAISAVPPPEVLPHELQLRMRDELFSQVFTPPQHFVLLSNAGVLELEKRRPVDVLQQLLQEERAGGAGTAAGAAAAAGAASSRVAEFFQSYGAAEAAAMCVLLAASPPGAVPTRAAEEALRALENTALVGEARMPEDVLAGGLLGAQDVLQAPLQPLPGQMLLPQQQPQQQQQQAQQQQAQPQAQAVPVAGAMGGPAGAGGIHMGLAVNPNPDPCWSGAHQGLCLYVSRLLHPMWEQQVVAPGKGSSDVLSCRFSQEAMLALETRLTCLDQFLRAYQQRLRVRGAARARADVRPPGPFSSLGDALLDGPPAAKRQRMMGAASMEEQRTAAVRALAGKACEALVLLQTLAAGNLGRLVAKLDAATRAALRGLTLRELSFGTDGQKVAATLVTLLVEEAQSGGTAVAEELTAHLQRRCPSYFQEADRVFYSAMGKLKEAEGAEGPERDALARAAVPLLLRVASSCRLEYVVSRLANLQQWEGMVDLVLRAASEADPGAAALHPQLRAEHEAACARREAAYAHVLQVLRGLLQPGANATPQLSPVERQRAKQRMLARCARCSDLYFHRVLYSSLADMGAAEELLALDPPHLEPHLAREGGLPAGQALAGAGVQRIGPLGTRQVQSLELLCRLYIGKKRFEDAAGVARALGQRRSGEGEQAVGLAERLQALQDALLQARSSGSTLLAEQLQADTSVVDIQLRIAERLPVLRQAARARGDVELEEALAQQEADISADLHDISHLYNNFAQPNMMWDMCLEICNFSGHADAFVCRQLWDLLLLQCCERAQPPTRAQQIEEMAAQVERLGARFHPSELSFPTPFVAMRMEQAAAGIWPSSAERPLHSDRVARALLAACRLSAPAVQRCYEALLARRAPGITEEDLRAPRLRLQLLRSLLDLCRLAGGGEPTAAAPEGLGLLPAVYSSQRRALAALADACDRYVHEARLLGTPEGDELALAFEDFKRQLAM